VSTPEAAPAALAPVAKKQPRQSVIRSSMVYSSLTLVSRLMGFARDLAITYVMGASATIAADAYNTALRFPNLFRRIFAEGAFAAAFVPAYSKALESKGEEEADVLAADAMATLAAATLVITIAADLAMPWLMHIISPGFTGAKYKLAVLLTQITMPYLPAMAIAAHLSGVLNARGRFIVSALHPTLLNLMMLLFVLPQHDPISAAKWASVGVLAAGASQAALLMWGVRKSGAKVDWKLPNLTPEVKQLIRLALPGAIAASATQINIFISGILASFVRGAQTWLTVADRLYQLPLGLVGVAIGVALLPRLSRAVHAQDHTGAQEATDEAVTFALAFTMPAAAALVAMPFYLIDGLYTRGEFTTFDAMNTASALFWYGLGTPAFVLTRVLAPAFFARQDTSSPMRFALISVAVNIAVGAGLFLGIPGTAFHGIGVQGIAAGTAVASWLTVVQMVAALHRRKDWTLGARAASRIGRILIATAIMGAALWAAEHWRFEYVQPLFEHLAIGFRGRHILGAKEISVAVVSIAAAVLYFAALFATGAIKLSELKRALKRGGKDAEKALEHTPAGPDVV
jgi:putative peptidoglycan lipid II flippase